MWHHQSSNISLHIPARTHPGVRHTSSARQNCILPIVVLLKIETAGNVCINQYSKHLHFVFIHVNVAQINGTQNCILRIAVVLKIETAGNLFINQ